MRKISFIIPAYNCEQYISKCIESIEQQEIQGDYEIIIVNDGSIDGTEQVIKKYANKNDKIKYIYQDNKGATYARNRGIEMANGGWVIFLDADDELQNGIINSIDLEEMEKEKIDLIIGNYKKIDKDGNMISSVQDYTENKKVTGEEIQELCVEDPKPGSKIYNLEKIKKENLLFDNVKIGQDLDFFLKYLIYCNNIYLTNKYMYKYRILDGSISRTYTFKILGIIDTFKCIKNFYIENNKKEIYEDKIVYAEAIHYYYQFNKLRYFENKWDRKAIFYIFKKYFKDINLKGNKSWSKKANKIIHKFKCRLIFEKLFTSNLNRYIYLKLKKGRSR